MARWSITPGDASISNNGVASFPANTGAADKVYTVTYTDDEGCTASTTYTVPSGSDCQCNCDDLIFDNSPISFNYNELSKEISITSACGDLTFETNSEWVSASQVNSRIRITVDENADTTERHATIKVKQDGIDCGKDISVSQKGKPQVPRLVFIPHGHDVYYSFGGGVPEKTEANLLRVNERLVIDSEGGVNILVPLDDSDYSLVAENGDEHYVYLDVMGSSFPGQETSSYYNCDEGKWYYADPTFADGSQDCMLLNELVACPHDANESTLSTIGECGGFRAHMEIVVSPQELLLTTSNMHLYPAPASSPFEMRAIVSETSYMCNGNRQPTPAFKNDAYMYPILFFVDK